MVDPITALIVGGQHALGWLNINCFGIVGTLSCRAEILHNIPREVTSDPTITTALAPIFSINILTNGPTQIQQYFLFMLFVLCKLCLQLVNVMTGTGQ